MNCDHNKYLYEQPNVTTLISCQVGQHDQHQHALNLYTIDLKAKMFQMGPNHVTFLIQIVLILPLVN